MLYAKVDDPLAAAIGGYYLQRVRAFERLHNWAQNLANWFPWMADGAIIHAWQLIQEARREGQARQSIAGVKERLLQARRRGPPLYTEGMTLLVEGLRWLHSATEGEDEEVIEALAWAAPYLMALDRSAPTTTFNGVAVDRPTAEPQVGRPLYREDLALLWGASFQDLLLQGLVAPGERVVLRDGDGAFRARLDADGNPVREDGEALRRLPVRALNPSETLLESMPLHMAVDALCSPPPSPRPSPEVLELAAKLDAQAAHSPSATGQDLDLMTEAGWLSQQLQADQAVRLMRGLVLNRQAVSDETGTLEARTKLLHSLAGAARFGEMAEQVEMVHAQLDADTPKEPLALFFREAGHLWMSDLREPDVAVSMLQQSIEAKSDDPATLQLLLDASLEVGDYGLVAGTAGRLADFAEVADLSEGLLEVSAKAFERIGELGGAAEAYRRLFARTRSPEHAEHLVSLYEQLGDLQSEGDLLLELAQVAESPADEQLLTFRAGQALAAAGDQHRADEAFRALAEKLDPTDIYRIVQATPSKETQVEIIRDVLGDLGKRSRFAGVTVKVGPGTDELVRILGDLVPAADFERDD